MINRHQYRCFIRFRRSIRTRYHIESTIDFARVYLMQVIVQQNYVLFRQFSLRKIRRETELFIKFFLLDQLYDRLDILRFQQRVFGVLPVVNLIVQLFQRTVQIRTHKGRRKMTHHRRITAALRQKRFPNIVDYI